MAYGVKRHASSGLDFSSFVAIFTATLVNGESRVPAALPERQEGNLKEPNGKNSAEKNRPT
jgi:hypothetical protein